MSNLDLTREWLQTVTRPYAAKERVVSEVLQILGERRTLGVKTDAFTFVVPTKEMGVRKGREVEPGGRVREEVVEEWWRSWEIKTTETLLRQLIAVFSAAPPVYARPPEAASPAQSSRSPAQSQPPAAMTNPPVSQTNGNGAARPPPPPARPTFLPPIATQSDTLPQYRSGPTPPPHPFPPQPHSRQASASYPTQAAPTPPPHPASPTVPPRPTWQGPQPQLPASPQAGPGSQRPYIPTTQGGYAPQHPMTPPRLAPVPDARPVYMANGWAAQSGQHPPQPQYAPSPTVAGSALQYGAPQNGPVAGSSQSGHQQPLQQAPPPVPLGRRPVQDLLSSPEESTIALPTTSDQPTGPPPIPPSKPPPPSLLHLHSILLPHLTASLPPLVHSLQSSRAHLLERQEDLMSGEPAIKDEMARLEAVKKVCDSVGRKMDETVSRGEDRVGELEGKGEVSVDELVCGISIVHNQLVDLVAEDNAIEDTIYHMTRALDAERVDLDRYLKSIRSLAREQYMKRALIERILQGMGQTGW